MGAGECLEVITCQLYHLLSPFPASCFVVFLRDIEFLEPLLSFFSKINFAVKQYILSQQTWLILFFHLHFFSCISIPLCKFTTPLLFPARLPPPRCFFFPENLSDSVDVFFLSHSYQVLIAKIFYSEIRAK